ncbi:MAG: DUF2892 domain-containing protein [Chitinophagaceae bacterium]|nr:DUF2892 domain-containing protein [Chitinophagaceae bacterium]
MKQNIGTVDATVRVFLSVLIAVFGYYYASWWGLLAFIPLTTAFFGVCPLYKLIGISTLKEKRK